MKMDKVILGILAAAVLAYCSMSAIEAATGTYSATGTASGTVTVTQYIDVTTPASITFGSVAPGTANSANTTSATITVNSNTNVDTNITLKGDPYFNWTTAPYTTRWFVITNMSYSSNATGRTTLTTAGTTQAERTGLGYDYIPAPSGGAAVIRAVYGWISIPTGQYASGYNATVTINITAL